MTYYHYELMKPRGLEKVIKDCPVAYVQMGTFEFHGCHYCCLIFLRPVYHAPSARGHLP